MQYTDIETCFEQLNAYFNCGKPSHLLFLNTENYDLYQNILVRLKADKSKNCVYVSDNVFPNGYPNFRAAIEKMEEIENGVLIGLSQVLRIQSNELLNEKIGELLKKSISGFGVILLEHCEDFLKEYCRLDRRVDQKVILINGERSALPQIKLIQCEVDYLDAQLLPDFKTLLIYLVGMTDELYGKQPSIAVVNNFPKELFRKSGYSIKFYEGTYTVLTDKYVDIRNQTKESFGNNEQWKYLANKIQELTDSNEPFKAIPELTILGKVVYNTFGSVDTLSLHIRDVFRGKDSNKKWLLWLAMKIFGVKGNNYLKYVMNNCDNYNDFIEHIYLDLAYIEYTDPDFKDLYQKRKSLLDYFSKKSQLIESYCNKLSERKKTKIFYLTDNSDREKYEFLRCLAKYDYTPEEIEVAVNGMSESLSSYLKEFSFDERNTKLADKEFLKELTTYFNQYKIQKLTNRIYSDFLTKVRSYASIRPYNKLISRSKIVSLMNKDNSQLYFFDALGVEYLAFIVAKCNEYGLISDIQIGRCELPSITEKNKEFLNYFPANKYCKIDKLDDVKHNIIKFNYETCKYPVHLFAELNVIEEELKSIYTSLSQGVFDKAIIVSDHGASRLAVLYGKECNSKIVLSESGEHSGRCCPVDEDPGIPCAEYENGYAVLANYERFKGGRRAEVEVHGGASLEEVLVPIITLTKPPVSIEMYFINSDVQFVPAKTQLELYSNLILKNPKLHITGKPLHEVLIIDGEQTIEKTIYAFSIPKIKKKGTYSAEVYDGDKNMGVTLSFNIRKQTKENEYF